MLRHKEIRNAYEKQEKTQNMQMQRSNKKTYQEQLEDHEEHLWMHEFLKNAGWICNWHQTYNMTQDSNKKHKNIFDFYDFLIFLDFYFIFFRKLYEKEK